MRADLHHAVGGEHREGAGGEARHEERTACALEGRACEQQEGSDKADVQDSQALETRQPLADIEDDVGQPGRREWRPRGGCEERIGAELRALGRVGPAQG